MLQNLDIVHTFIDKKLFDLSGVHWEPIFFELSSIYKLQNFVAHHKIEENPYLSSPNLMIFEENKLHDDLIGDGSGASKEQKNYKEEDARDFSDDEMIDIESIPNCYVTSSSDKVINYLFNLVYNGSNLSKHFP